MIVTCDFDHTLMFEYGFGPNRRTLRLIKPFEEIIIVTSRHETWGSRKEILDFCDRYNVPVNKIYFTNGESKKDTLLKLGSELHFEDDEEDIKSIRRAGITVVDCYNKRMWLKITDFINS